MANTSSAKKALRAADRRWIFNLRRKSAVKDAVKAMEKLAAAKDARAAANSLPALYQAIDKAVKRNVIRANTGARMKSRAARALRALSA